MQSYAISFTPPYKIRTNFMKLFQKAKEILQTVLP